LSPAPTHAMRAITMVDAPVPLLYSRHYNQMFRRQCRRGQRGTAGRISRPAADRSRVESFHDRSLESGGATKVASSAARGDVFMKLFDLKPLIGALAALTLAGAAHATAPSEIRIGYAISKTGPYAGGASTTVLPNYQM